MRVGAAKGGGDEKGLGFSAVDCVWQIIMGDCVYGRGKSSPCTARLLSVSKGRREGGRRDGSRKACWMGGVNKGSDGGR
jgi:hypothetical protein